jgi:quercetin dioxygenase-like cupin family protein
MTTSHAPDRYESRALHVPSGEGTTKWVSGDVYTITSAEQTNGAVGFVVAMVPPGHGPIAHIHSRHDEAFYLLEGEVEFLNGDETFIASTGDFVFVPRGVRHRFKAVSSQAARMIVMSLPGGQERFLLEYGDDPVPGRQPEPWGMDRFTPEMIAFGEQLGNVIVPEEDD